MRRIAGAFMMLAAFSGCTSQPRLAQNDFQPMPFQGRTTVAGSSWPRSEVPSGPMVSDGSSLNRGVIGLVSAPQQSPAGMMVPPSGYQTAAKPSYQPINPPSPPPAPVANESTNTNTGVVQTGYAPTIDKALMGAPWVVDRGVAEEVTAPASPTPAPTPSPAKLPVMDAQPIPVAMPDIQLEPKQLPVAVAIDTKSSPGSPALRLVNTKRFSLSYAVQDGGAGGSVVDLWETRDSKTWKKCEHARAQPGAYLVEVKDEGVFGYTMVARATSDKGNTQPKSGDVPQVWVTVDATKPTVSLTGVELNLTSKTPNLIIRWTAKDKNFGPRPITLSFADQADGPWMPLAANIENNGRHECAIPASMPKRAFLRIEAVDLVGNSGSAQTDKLVRLDFTAPTVASLLPPPPQAGQAPPVVEQPRPLVIIYGVEPSTATKE